MAAALAVFVKTPSLSPVKTRLAADIGGECAEKIYSECLQLMRRRMRAAAAAGIAVYWAVAEQEAASMPCWGDFPAEWTGAGGLGQRLHQIYSRLRRRHGRVILAGADCPQLSAETILRAAAGADTLAGPARDGGFYLFAAGIRISAQQWLAPEYSSAQTLAMLTSALAGSPVTLLPVLTDIDDSDSLRQCIAEFTDRSEADTLRALLPAAGA